MLLAAAIGVPLYLSTGLAIPVIQSLLAKRSKRRSDAGFYHHRLRDQHMGNSGIADIFEKEGGGYILDISLRGPYLLGIYKWALAFLG